MIYNLQNNTEVISASINKNYFSKVDNFNANSEYCLDLVKTIYEKTPFPTNKGGFEKSFLEFLDNDSEVIKFIKIMEFKHDFSTITYFRDDGLMARYYPDFMVQTKTHNYIIETKADRDKDNKNVLQKKRATVDYVNRINKLDNSLRDNKVWEYLLVFQDKFNKLKDGANIYDIASESNINVKTTLFD
jgi:type III restriction enzyme